MDIREQRIRLQKEKAAIPDREVFLSERYIRLLKTIAGEITDGRPVTAKVYADPSDHLGGWCDGKQIAINIMNSFTQSFPTVSLRSDSIVGILGHECGHMNFTDSGLRRKYLEQIEKGGWYPAAPSPACEKEKEDLQKIEACFQKKDAAALGILTMAASYIHNDLEDVFVEGEMCRRYPGSIKRGILLNRRRRLEQFPSVKKQISMGFKKLSILLNLVTQHALSGKINNWDGYKGEETTILAGLAPVIGKAVASETTMERVQATNQILLKLWDPIWEEIVDMQEKLEAEPKGSHEKEKHEEGQREGTEKEGTEKEEGLLKAIQELGGQLQVFFVKEFLWEGRGDSPAKSETGGKSIETKEEVSAILFALAKAHVREKAQMEIQAGLRRGLQEIPFESGHGEVKKEVLRQSRITEEARKRYESEKGQIRRVTRRLSALLLPILQRQAGSIERGRLFGPQMYRKHMSDRQGRIFQKRVRPDTNLDTALVVLMDLSNSMASGGRIEAARRAALCLYAFCREAKLPIAVYGHHTDGRQHLSVREETVYLHSLAEFEPDREDRYRILMVKPSGANRDGTALLYAGHRLLKRPERKKILFLISDGFPNATLYRGEEAKKDLLEIKKRLNKKGITFLAAAIGSDKESISEIYQEAFLDISDLGKLPAVLSRQLLIRIKRR